MFIFPKTRHERAPIAYCCNVFAIIIAFLNLMALPAYSEIERAYHQRQLNQQLLEKVDVSDTLADSLNEIKTILQVLHDDGNAGYQLLATSDPVLKQGVAKQRERLAVLAGQLPSQYTTALDDLVNKKTALLAQGNPALTPIIETLASQIEAMQSNYERLINLVEANLTGTDTPSMRIMREVDVVETTWKTEDSDVALLNLLNNFDTSPAQQTQTGPSAITQSQSDRIHNKARATEAEFSDEQAISQAQLTMAAIITPIEKSLQRPQRRVHPPNFITPLADANKYRGESDEIQLTDRIKAKAEALDYDPVKIYYWVRNHIEFVPTWGAYQTAEHTLGSRQGNAFDTASLLIALLRSSNIPARYVQGSIRVTPEKFMNWIGDFDDVNAATRYAGNLGMRVTTLINPTSNQVVGVEIEHAWVEAAIDFHPSRGMVNKIADMWLPMDASFKQYEYLEGLDVEQIGGIDAEKLVKDFEASGSINETEGWTQGFDASIIEKAQQDAQKKLEAHIKTMTDPTVGDVLGGNKVIVKEYPVLSAGLSNPIVVRGTDYIKVPSNYQAKIGLALRNSTTTGIINIPQPPIDNELTYYPLSKFNSEKTILRFSPASDADKKALEALVPANATSVNDLPQFIGSGINVIPELVLNDKVVLKGSAMPIGRDVQIGYKARLPNIRNTHKTMVYDVIAGSYLHIPIVGYSVKAFRLVDTQKRVEKTQKILESKDQTQLKNLTREDILGDIFYTGGLGYFVQLHMMNRMASHYGNGIGRVPIGYGSYGYEPKVKQAGILANPVGIMPGSIATNVRVQQSHWRKNSQQGDNNIAFTMGMNSSILESAISEQLFCNEKVNPTNEPCYGISTVSGLQRAAQQGQKIYQINQNNRDQLKNITMSDSNMADDINKAIASGGYVIVPEKAVDGSGRDAIYVYMTYDGQTGHQSWKISGGLNGAWLSGLVIGFGFGVFLIATVLLAVGLIAASLLLVGLLMALLVTALIAYFYVLEQVVEDEELRDCFGQGILFGMDIASAAYLHFGTTGKNLITALVIGEMYFTRNSPSCEFY